jgi:hypothetical protein
MILDKRSLCTPFANPDEVFVVDETLKRLSLSVDITP